MIRLCIILSISLISFSISMTQRFALITGMNNGGPKRDILKYAVIDAQNFASVMEEMGGIPRKNQILLEDPSAKRFSNAIAELNNRVVRAKTSSRIEVVVYYSGHADERGLLFNTQRFDYRKLRKALESIPADVRITILDACASGTITRLKGGTHSQAFLVDASSDMTGYAFITSSSDKESAQESDAIGGSFFTHYLVSGLRGAADASQDKKITLSESYQFAFHETLARTENTMGGAQHPSYDMKLSGKGDVVMTDLPQWFPPGYNHQDHAEDFS